MTETNLAKMDRPDHPVVTLRQRLTVRQPEIEAALEGSGISFNQMRRAIVSAAYQNPDLYEKVKFESLWLALLKACRDGLLPDGVQGAIVPFGGNATWIAMYRGLISRFEKTEHYKWIGAGFHRADDLQWRVWTDETGPHFIHEQGPGMGDIIETYAAATTKSGGFFISIVNATDMSNIRGQSRASREDSPWNKWPEQMMLKSALRRLTKMLPMPEPLSEFVARDLDNASATPVDDEPAPAAPAPKQVPKKSARASLDEFAGQPQSENPAPPENKAADIAKTPADYFRYAEAIIDEHGDKAVARAWFVGDEQRKMRKTIGIPVDDVVAFSARMFPK